MPIFITLDLPDFMFACLIQYLGVSPPPNRKTGKLDGDLSPLRDLWGLTLLPVEPQEP